MSCKNCNINPIWKFTNKQQLCEKCFAEYFERKVKSTIRKYNMPIQAVKGNSVKAKVINSILKNLPERKGKISEENLDDISLAILNEVMHGKSENLKKFLPKNQLLYFISYKEIEIYAKIKKIKGTIKEATGKKKKLNDFIKRIEEKNPDIRHNVVLALINSS